MMFCSVSLGRGSGVQRCRGDGGELANVALCGLLAEHCSLLRCYIRKYTYSNKKSKNYNDTNCVPAYFSLWSS